MIKKLHIDIIANLSHIKKTDFLNPRDFKMSVPDIKIKMVGHLTGKTANQFMKLIKRWSEEHDKQIAKKAKK